MGSGVMGFPTLRSKNAVGRPRLTKSQEAMTRLFKSPD